MRIFTIGHSNQPLASFIETLTAHSIQLVADVRRFPTSRRHPHFTRAPLMNALRVHGIEYHHVPALGGHREPRRDSPNTALRVDAFRGYADHMETAEFAQGIALLVNCATRRVTVMMCAELRWTECHRAYISDFLKAQDHDVIHIASPARGEEHPYTKFARVVNRELSYRGLL